MITEDINNIDNLYLEDIIDIRDDVDYQAFNIPGIIHIKAEYFTSNPDLYIDFDHTYYLVCQNGDVSYEIIKKLVPKGYNLVHLVGGMKSYKGGNYEN